MTRSVVQRFFDPRPGDAIDDAGDFAEELLRASDQEILEAAGVRRHDAGEYHDRRRHGSNPRLELEPPNQRESCRAGISCGRFEKR